MLAINQLAGFGAGGAAGVESITQVLSATSTGSTINFPGGISAGDLIVLLDFAANGFSAPSDVTPSGFTRIGTSLTATASFVGYRQNAWYKHALGTESGSLTGLNGDIFNEKAMLVFRGNIAATTLTVGSVGEQITTGNPTAQNCTASGGVAPLVVLGGYSSSGTISPRTFSTTKDGEVGTWLAWKIYNSAPADSSIDMDDEGDMNALKSCYIQMA